MAIVGLCTITLHLPGVSSLKEKRGIVKSMLAKLHNKFNLSTAETDHQDLWQSAEIAIALVANSELHIRKAIKSALDWLETNYPDAIITKHEIEIL